jgi:hypothetical protein
MVDLRQYPDIFDEWCHERNTINPEKIVCGLQYKVWWHCKKACGNHRWESEIRKRIISGRNCPYCVNKSICPCKCNSLQCTHPDILDEWDYEKNILKPDEITKGSEKKTWWLCKKGCGHHSWYATVKTRTKGSGCAICANVSLCPCGCNSLLKRFPDIAQEFDEVKNSKSSSDLVYGSNQKVWWKCKNNYCGHHVWETKVSNRTLRKSGCPYCAKTICPCGCNSIERTHPELLTDWDYQKNSIHPSKVKFGSPIKVWWVCNKCNSSKRFIKCFKNDIP